MKPLMKPIWLASCLLALSTYAWAAPRLISAEPNAEHYSGADVDQTIVLKNQDMNVKVFSYSGGDPAINGAYLNLAVYDEENRGWNVFALKDVLDYKVLPSAQKGYAKIALVTQDIDQRSGNIRSYKSTLFINLRNADQRGGKIEVDEIKQK